MTASGQNRWPPTGSYVTAYGQDLMAADIGGTLIGLRATIARLFDCMQSSIFGDRDSFDDGEGQGSVAFVGFIAICIGLYCLARAV